MAQASIAAAARTLGGKGAARAVRREGKVPAVIYGGDEKDAQVVALNSNELVKTISKGRFLSTVFEIEVGGKKIRAIPRDVQLDPVRDTRSTSTSSASAPTTACASASPCASSTRRPRRASSAAAC